MGKKFVNPCKIITGASTRWSYANVFLVPDPIYSFFAENFYIDYL